MTLVWVTSNYLVNNEELRMQYVVVAFAMLCSFGSAMIGAGGITSLANPSDDMDWLDYGIEIFFTVAAFGAAFFTFHWGWYR